MEDYDKFVEFHLSQLKKTKDVNLEERPKSSSLICFHGRPILPPVLSGPQREEMSRFREAAERKCKDGSRMSYVQAILHSVHIRKTPTLEELLKESDDFPQTLSSVSGLMSQNIFTEKSLPKLFKPTEETHHPLTSTTCSALLTSHVQPQKCHRESGNQFHQVSHSGLNSCSPNAYCQSLSSGYDSYMNVENTANATGSLEVENVFLEKRGDSDEDFFNHDSSDTVKKMPDIINYPPVDGEELERSGQESAFVTDLKEKENPESASFIEASSGEDYSAISEGTETSCLVNQSNSLKVAEAKCGLNDQPKDAPVSICLTPIDTHHVETMQTDDEDSKATEDPYRMSLQTLLKKSQEYRRRQRMLRSHSKNAKILGRAQDQPKSEEQSLSDKENDEWHSKGTQLNKSQEKSNALSPTVDQSLKRSFENDEKSEEIPDKTCLTIDSQVQDSILTSNSDSYDSIKINNWVNSSGPKSVSLSVPKWIKNFNKSSDRNANTSPTALEDVKKYRSIPAPFLCKSPVSCKVKRPSPPFDKISQKDTVINNSMNKKHKEEPSNYSSSALNVAAESDVTSVLAKSSQHIDQLEFNLSGLKVLISDLELTLTENVDKSSSQSESQQMHPSQNNVVGWFGDVCPSQENQSLDSIERDSGKTLQTEQVTDTIKPQEAMITTREKADAQNTRRPSSAKCILSATQRMLIPDVFRICLPDATAQNYVSALSDRSNRLVISKFDPDVSHDSCSTSLNQSYDVEAPSELWLQRECGPQRCDKVELTPESGGNDQGVGSKVKRRLQMTDDIQEKGDEQGLSVSRPNSSTPKAAARWHEGLDSVKERKEQLRQIHAAQIRALQEEHRRQQELLLQTSKARYCLLHATSLPYSMSTSRHGDTVTFPTLSQPSAGPLPEHHRHLLSAAAKGFLTRRLLKTERVAQLVRTVRDTQQFLKAFHQQSPNKAFWSRQDLMLHERVTLQLRATRYEIYDIFFSLTAGERMQLISMDRDLIRERELRRQNGAGGQLRGRSSLSAATQKSLERKRGLMIQKKTVERHRGAGMRTRHKPGSSAEQPLETRAGQFRANPQRVPKSTYTSRPR